MEDRNQQIFNLLAQLDRDGETAAPDEEDDETAGPEDEDEDDVANAELEAEEDDTGDIRALQKRGRHTISLDEAKILQARSRRRGRKAGKRAGRMRFKLPTPPPNLIPPSRAIVGLFEKWKKRGIPFVTRTSGHYYYATEIVCDVLGNKERAFVRVKAGEYKFFDKAVEDECMYMGTIPGKVTTAITNFQRPSKHRAFEHEFLIQSISMQEAGLRVRYDPGDIQNIPGIGQAIDPLSGKTTLWDDAGIFLPKQIFHDFTNENLLYRAIRRSGVLYFAWEQKRIGGNGTSRQVLIDHLRQVPDVRVKSLARTSGGTNVLHVADQGFIFSNDPDNSDYGAFSAKIVLDQDVAFPVQPIDLGGGTVKPLQIAVYVQLSLNGIGFEPAGQQVLA